MTKVYERGIEKTWQEAGYIDTVVTYVESNAGKSIAEISAAVSLNEEIVTWAVETSIELLKKKTEVVDSIAVDGIKAKTDLINSALGSGTLNTGTSNPHTATLVPTSLPTKMHLAFDISNLNTNLDDFEVQVSVGASASERVIAWYGLTSDGTDITCDEGSGVGSVIKQRRIDISNILVYTAEQVIVSLKRNAGADDTVDYKYLCGV